MKVQACGVCHTDLHYREGGISDDFPFLLGHEAAGMVEAVGPDVTGVAPGDFVVSELARGVRRVPRVPAREAVVLLRDPQRRAEDDARGRHAAVARPGHRRVRREDAGRRRAGDEGRTRGAARGRRPARVRCDGRLRCGGEHGRRAAERHRRRVRLRRGRRRRDRGARLVGARTIIAVDSDPRKLEWAKDFGATHTVDASRRRTRSSGSRSSPRATAPTCASRPSGGPKC